MISSVTIDNFKSLRHQEISLDRLTVFVGANASGKTSVLDVLHFAVRAAVGEPRRVFGYERHCDWLYTRGGSGDLSVACTTSGGTFSVSATPPAGFPPQQTDLLGKGIWTFRVLPDDRAALESALQPVRSMVFLHLNARQLAKPAYSTRPTPRVEHNGQGLASVLAYMALNDPDGFEALVEEMRRLIPHLRRIRFRKVPVRRIEKELVKFGNDTVERRSPREYQGDSLLFDFHNANNVSADVVSEGTLMLLGLMTVLLGPSPPQILLIDDLEHGLHPLAQKILLEILRQVMERFPNLQIIATAHSPYLLDEVRAEEIRLMTIGNDGYSVCGRLTDHPQFDRWKQEMAPGELWSMFGERWLVSEGATR